MHIKGAAVAAAHSGMGSHDTLNIYVVGESDKQMIVHAEWSKLIINYVTDTGAPASTR